MTPKQFEKFLKRDGHCWHCGADEGLVPHHRKNRGMGGSKVRDVPSNIIVMCAEFNQRMESDSWAAQEAREKGWKLESWQDPYKEPCVDDTDGFEWYLDDTFGRSLRWVN